MPFTPSTSAKSRTLSQLAGDIKNSQDILLIAARQEALESPDGVPNGNREAHQTVHASRGNLMQIVVELGDVETALGGTPESFNGGGPNGEGEAAIEGTDFVGANTVVNAADFTGTSTIQGNTQPLPAGTPSTYFSRFASVLGLYLNAGDTLEVLLNGITSGDYIMQIALGGSVGGGTFDVSVNGSTPVSVNAKRSVDTEIHGIEIASPATLTGTNDSVLFTCTASGQLNLAHIDAL